MKSFLFNLRLKADQRERRANGRRPRITWRALRQFILTAAASATAVAVVFVLVPWLIASGVAGPHEYTVDSVPRAQVALVFGAGLGRDGTPSAVLRDRVEQAVRLYQAGKVDKLIMSGDNRFVEYNEPGAMRDYAVKLGVPAEDIVLDFAGRRTYDTCYRARHIFNIRSAVVVTQSFHMTRALFTCSSLGIDASGVPSDIRSYSRRLRTYWQARELAAIPVAIWQVWVERPLPVLGEPEPVFPITGRTQ